MKGLQVEVLPVLRRGLHRPAVLRQLPEAVADQEDQQDPTNLTSLAITDLVYHAINPTVQDRIYTGIEIKTITMPRCRYVGITPSMSIDDASFHSIPCITLIICGGS